MAIRDLVPRFGRSREGAVSRRADYDIFREFQRQMNRLFEEFMSDFPLVPRWSAGELVTSTFSPRVDVSETEKEVKVSVELPGLEEKDVTVELDDEAVTIRGERKEEKEEKGRSWYTKEQTYGSFCRVVPLPTSVDGEKARAKFKNGVLTITIPKLEEEQSKRKVVKIESE